ncbi:hypothetical protein BpHYR1_019575 [Brachionus plicatilis]|uniref:Uncharacterized protein n=1 Tax=Brachionus plicatilis TaxID=10195 RepID=A0A3M7Q425_BRAPC|nr:hypothetical protein BpHYR1_019575 [Brachionus plicatilis]
MLHKTSVFKFNSNSNNAFRPKWSSSEFKVTIKVLIFSIFGIFTFIIDYFIFICKSDLIFGSMINLQKI